MHRRHRSRSPALVVAAITAFLVGCVPPPDVSSDGSTVDEARLDRTVDAGPCGYPSEGPEGYGNGVGQRLDHGTAFELTTCDGERVELADYLCRRDDAYGDFNRGILVTIGAGWCGPCQEETLELPELYEEYHPQGIEIVQVMFQDWTGQAPTAQFCEDWSAGAWGEDVGIELEFPVVLDVSSDWSSLYVSDNMAAVPVNLLVDANANIRWQVQGQKPAPDVLRTQLDLVLGDPYGD
jgi:thiol-disulfide isomerase/thioredoxin